ncbi:MAG: stearoyl-CoA 9-desaturase [Actinobacteria bacterium]|nr:stearoyl-CoA 9-desaturase [Actinomycetota bacterium]MBM3697618.1 stearoyl-CoA 9-desaturase [Actinomycetota bacterium]
MGVVIIPLTLLVAWILGLAGVSAPGASAGASWDELVLHWTLFMPVGIVFLVSAVMHTVLARRTAASIGWQTNGFQYEIGFVSLGLGIAGIWATYQGSEAWIAVAIPTTAFLFLAGVNHLIEMVRDRNYAPGNSVIIISDFGTPITLWAMLAAVGAL